MRYFNLRDFLLEAFQKGVSDVMFVPGTPLTVISGGRSMPLGENMMPQDTEHIVREIYALSGREHMAKVFDEGDDNFSFTLPSICRFRASIFRQRNSYGCIIRLIPFSFPSAAELNIPPQVTALAAKDKGLILVAGDSGCGKTTTIAVLLREINASRTGGMIITLDDPLEYLHRHDKCTVIQREIFTDTKDYISGIEASLYQRPDVMEVSAVPDADVARAMIRVAKSGRLMFTAVYGSGTADTLNSLLGMFPKAEQDSVRESLASVLQAVVYQCMVPGVDGKQIPAFEVAEFDDALLAMLREGRMTELQQAVCSSRASSVLSLDRSLVDLYRAQKITQETALKYASDRGAIRRQLY